MAPSPLRVATRGSALARWQASSVARALGVETVELVVETSGDRRRDVPISVIGRQGVFVKEVQAAVLDGGADLAVHSAKDLPATPSAGLVIAAVPRRADPRDALVGGRLSDLPPGARVATGSVRRRAQLASARPDLTFAELRGNIETRVARAAEHAAAVVALAALERLGLEASAAEILDPATVCPQVGQGALAVECREGDRRTAELLAGIEHGPSRRAVDAERAFLAALGGGCDLPVGALASAADGGRVTLDAVLATADGRVVLHHRAAGGQGVLLGQAVAAHLLWSCGGADLLEDSGGQWDRALGSAQ